MAASQSNSHAARSLLRLLVPLLGSDLIELLPFLWRLAKRTIKFKAHEGMYEVLDYHAQLELLDAGGTNAILRKRQQVLFQQDHIIAFQDKAFGDGDIFAAYECAPGVAVDKYREGHRTRILISLRETKHRGDVEEFRIDRTIHDGFTNPSEDLQIDIDHVTRKLALSAVFPPERLPKQVMLLEQNSTRSVMLGPEHMIERADGRCEVHWSTDRPRLFEAYILRWAW